MSFQIFFNLNHSEKKMNNNDKRDSVNFREIQIKTFNRYLNLPKTLTNKRFGANFNDLKILGKDFTSKEKISFLFKSGINYCKKKGTNKHFIKFKPLLKDQEENLGDSFTMDNSAIFNKNDKESRKHYKKT